MVNTAVLLLALASAPDDTSRTGPDRELAINAGFGFSSYDDKPKATSAGFYGEVDYIQKAFEWLYPKAYVGLLLSGANRKSCNGTTPCDVANRIGFAGLKARLIAPFDYVKPYVEAGGGVSIGTITTRIGGLYENPNRHVFGHLAVALGLAIGKAHQVDVGFNFLIHPSRDQSAGGITLGVRIPF
ncbi:MAG: hypothetical protein H7Z43_12510 [Clostridia bacterium]|nr:hypothetical protein [Deltaproteobacteria bacterium]